MMSGFCPAHKFTDREKWSAFNKHLNVIARECVVDDGHNHFVADLLDDFTHPDTRTTDEHLSVA